MALDSKYYGDPALHVKYERQTNRCYGCKHSITIADFKFCEKGIVVQKLTKPCGRWAKK